MEHRVERSVKQSVQTHWRDLRGRTYDLLDVLVDADLNARLPFAESQNILYQFYCMLGTQESWLPVLLEGGMRGWSCSLKAAPAGEALPIGRVRAAMEAADEALETAFERADWLRVFENGATPLAGYYRLVEHESHHHGQLINLIYANNLPIPESWADSWALKRNGE